jgi:hypothetical protein
VNRCNARFISTSLSPKGLAEDKAVHSCTERGIAQAKRMARSMNLAWCSWD